MKKNIIALVVLTCLIFSITSSMAETVTTMDFVRLREQPKGCAVTSVPKGTTLQVLSKSKLYTKVCYKGKTGWMYNIDLLKFNPDKGYSYAYSSKYGKILFGKVKGIVKKDTYIYAKPDKDSAKIFLPIGAKVTATAYSQKLGLCYCKVGKVKGFIPASCLKKA